MGNPTSVTINGVQSTATYNAANDLIAFGSTTYTYDANGNRLTQTVNGVATNYTYDNADQLTDVNGTSYSSDANGNLTAAGSDTFSWDAHNQLTSATVNGSTTDYGYDGSGNQVSRTSNGTTTTNLWDGSSGMAQLVDDGSTSYVQGNGAQEAIDSGNTTSYPLTDALGSIRGVTDSSGTLTGTTGYDAFGAVRSQTGTSLALGYTGQLTDPSTGFVDLRARQYDPTLGRFLSTDTVQPNAPGTQGYNLYAYTANNPTTWTDLSGHMSAEITELLGLVGAEGLLALLVSPELVGIVAVGVFVAVVIWAVVAILSCVLDAACMDRLQQQGHAIKQYGSAAAAGAWTLGGAATRTAWHNFPGTPKGALCALGAAESMVASAVTNGITGQKTSASDYWYAAGMGCATGGSGGNGPKIYRGKTSAPQWPDGFTSEPGQTYKVNVKNQGILSSLRSVMPGKWQKVYENGWLNGQQVSMHYFQHESGAVFDVELHSGWSTKP